MKKNYLITLFYTLLVILTVILTGSMKLSAQDNVGGQPMSSMLELNSEFNTVRLPEVDSKKLLDEDKIANQTPGMPFRYATLIDVSYNLQNSGTWETLSDGSRVWRLGITSPDAKTIGLVYNNFYMPKGATLFIYNSDKSVIRGGFTELNNSSSREFVTSPTPGSYTIIEYYEPEFSKGLGSISIVKVIHDYVDILGFNSFLELPCNININCPIGAPWVDQKRSVAKMTFNFQGGGYLCTGSLMNNTLNNLTPYFLTAQHCESDNWNTLVLDFNFESPTCSGAQSGPTQSVIGATNKAENFDTDFRLLQLNNPVPSSTNAYFNGWDRSGTQPANETAIHQPGGAIKKISVDNNPAQTSSGFGGRLPNGFWAVFWDQGMTEGGSSGCPLYDQNKRVIGQNLGGNQSQCENPQIVQKVFGKFSESWAHGGVATNQLKDWLDPNNSGVTTLDGINLITGVAPVSNFTSSTQSLPIGGGSVDFYDLSTNGPTTWSWSFPGGTPSTSNVQNPTGISYTATGAYTVTLTTTNSFGSNMKTFVNYIKVAGVPLTPFSLKSPASNSTVIVTQNDPTLYTFSWGSSTPDPSVKYVFRIKKVGALTLPEYFYSSNNNGLDSSISIRKSFLDSLAVSMGTTGDSVRCQWKASALNGLDTLTANAFLIYIRRMPVGINQISSIVPEQFKLYNNYPNPFNPNTLIKFDISKNQFVSLKVYNLLGEEISTLVSENLSPGTYNVDFNAAEFSSGIYFYRLETQGYVDTKRMMLVK